MKHLALLASAYLLLPASAVMAQTADACEKLKIENAKLKFENANLKKGIIRQSGSITPVAGGQESQSQSFTQQKQTVQQVDFVLLKCQGNSKAQTVTATLLLTNTAPNRDLQFESVRAIDGQGEEYKTFDIRIGTQSQRGALPTGIPVKATFVIPKVLPSVKQFKLLACPVYDASQPGRSLNVEFRDVAISWN